jgi:hypothetical protein
MTQPTAHDRESAAVRPAVAARFQAEYDQAKSWARELFGPGWLPSCRHFLLDKDDEDRARKDSSKPRPAATVFTAEACWGKRHFVVRDGRPVEVADYREGFGPMLLELDPVRKFTDQAGRFHNFHRYSLCWSSFPLYEPQTAEQLAEAREKRQAKRLAAERAALPLFADQF